MDIPEFIKKYVDYAKNTPRLLERLPEAYRKPRNITLAVAGVIAVTFGGTYISRLSTPSAQELAQKEVSSLVTEVSKLVVLPDGEEPVIATVNDPEKLRDQAFFAKAQKGDKVLIYNGARKAILYSASLKRVLDIVQMNAPTPTPVP